MAKHFHEIRDPIHTFVRLDSDERKVVDARAFQRLRHIHQLALTYQIYPAATHKRFEHSLGVMELASRVYDVITRPDNVSEQIRNTIPELAQPDKITYWRRVLRLAALCHDMGHLPFSHAAEEQLLPKGWDHEKLSQAIIVSSEMKAIWDQMTPPVRTDDIVKLALGPKKAKHLRFTAWETILSEVITGDSFGVDRIDYLLRDSYHAGVAYGKFDHYRLTDTLRILTDVQPSSESDPVPKLGIDEGGLHSAEALLLARYYMYSQVYFHPVRRIYDIHLKDFLAAWLDEGKFSIDTSTHLAMSDNDVNAAIWRAAIDGQQPGHDAASRIAHHNHYRVLYQRNPNDVRINPHAAVAVFEAAQTEFGPEFVRFDNYAQKQSSSVFPVLLRDGTVASSVELSETLAKLPVVSVQFVFVSPHLLEKSQKWLAEHRSTIIEPKKEQN
jgi:HD superfamily phosphohydrolase